MMAVTFNFLRSTFKTYMLTVPKQIILQTTKALSKPVHFHAQHCLIK